MTADGPQIQEQPRRGIVLTYRALAVALGALVVAAAIGVLVWQFAFTSSPARVPGMKLGFPSDWAQVSPGTLRGTPPGAVVALLRKDKKAVVIVVRNGPVKLDASTVTSLEQQLKAKYSDFKPLRSQMIQVRAGRALLLSYERTKQGKHGELDTVTIIPAGAVSFVLDTTSPFGDAKIDHELYGIIGSAEVVR